MLIVQIFHQRNRISTLSRREWGRVVGRKWEKDEETKKAKGERSYEMMKLKQEAAAEEGQEEGKHIKCKVGELDEEKGKEGSCICLPHC